MSDNSLATERRAWLLAQLRAAPGPLSTTELAAACPAERVTRSTRCPAPRSHDDPRTVECVHGHITQMMRPGATNVYANLRQLERAGRIESLRPAGARAVYWQAMPTVDPDAWAAVEASWAAS